MLKPLTEIDLIAYPTHLKLKWAMTYNNGKLNWSSDEVCSRLYCEPFPEFGKPALRDDLPGKHEAGMEIKFKTPLIDFVEISSILGKKGERPRFGYVREIADEHGKFYWLRLDVTNLERIPGTHRYWTVEIPIEHDWAESGLRCRVQFGTLNGAVFSPHSDVEAREFDLNVDTVKRPNHSSMPSNSATRYSNEQSVARSSTSTRKTIAFFDSVEVLKMFKMAYLLLRVDQFSQKLGTGSNQDSYLWGWSLCDPRRKEKVATGVPRAASLVISSFIISAYSSSLNEKGFGIQSEDITISMINSLSLRYHQHGTKYGVYGTPKYLKHEDGEPYSDLSPNCRHISAALSILLRVIQNEVQIGKSIHRYRSSFNQIRFALDYLISLEDYWLFSQDPLLVQEGYPDSATCAIVLELLEYVGIAAEIVNVIAEDQPNYFEEIEQWCLQKIQDGIDLLNVLKFQVAGHNQRFWEFIIDRDRLKHRFSKGIPPLPYTVKEIDLYHTTRVLYLVRNLLTKPEYADNLIPIVNGIATILKNNKGALPKSFPLNDDQSCHITNTALFLNALVPDNTSAFNREYTSLLNLGVERLSELFSEGLFDSLSDHVDGCADGMAMILRLAQFSSEFKSVPLRALSETADRIQTHIKHNNINQIKDELATVGLDECFPLIEERVIKPRRQWIEEHGT